MRSILLLFVSNFCLMLMVPTVKLGTHDLPSLAASRAHMPCDNVCNVPPVPIATTPDLYAPEPSFFCRPAAWRSPRTVAILQIGDILTL